MTDDASSSMALQAAPIVGSAQPVPQTIIIQCPKKSSRKERFKDRISLIIGITLITSASVAIFIGGFGVWTFFERHALGRYGYGYGHTGFVPFWTAPFIYLSGSFAIASSKTKRRGFIITTMVLSILSAVFSTPLIGVSSWIIADEQLLGQVQPRSPYLINGEFITENPQDFNRAVSLQKGSLAIGVFLLLCGLVDLISSILLSALCCAVTCCVSRSTDTSQVVFLNSPPGVSNMTDQCVGDAPMYQGNIGQASGGDLPPPYSESEVNKVNLGRAEAGECPTKAPLF